jgi:pimeloyl-ACP methyl ester carboxylesterase
MMKHTSIWQHLFKTPHRLGWVDVAGVNTRYLEAGPPDAPTVILLHGTAGSLENFSANYAAYSRHFHVIGLDMLGCGWTDKPDHDYQIKDYVEHVRGFMDAMGIAQACVVGVSLGGWVGAALALAHPARVARLVLVSPAGIITDPEEEKRFGDAVRKSRSSAAAEPTWETVSASLSFLVLDAQTLSDELVAVRLEIYRDPRMKAAMPHLLAFSLGGQALDDEQWRSIAAPILVIAAVDAPNMFLGNAYAIARAAPNAQLLEMKGCDHWAQYEQPEAFNAHSIAFLRGT